VPVDSSWTIAGTSPPLSNLMVTEGSTFIASY
jgi:hypothetical protein